jgi:hypothetical protein
LAKTYRTSFICEEIIVFYIFHHGGKYRTILRTINLPAQFQQAASWQASNYPSTMAMGLSFIIWSLTKSTFDNARGKEQTIL